MASPSRRGALQQRAVLALLLCAAPEPVSRDQLIAELWGERPPAEAAHAVQVYESGLRKALRVVVGGWRCALLGRRPCSTSSLSGSTPGPSSG